LIHLKKIIEPPGVRLDEGSEATNESSFFDLDSPSNYISSQEQGALLDPNHRDAVRKTKLAELYETIIESTDLASKKRRTVKVLESDPPRNTLLNDRPSD
jgi:hypothetical protein